MSPTRVCVRCGWFVHDRERCTRDGGPTISHRAAEVACGVSTLFCLLHVTPSLRVASFQRRRSELVRRARDGGQLREVVMPP